MATLSCAMVGPMDGIELLNASRVMTSCRKDGVVLKPAKPVATSDACFRAADPTCFTYHTFDDVPIVGAPRRAAPTPPRHGREARLSSRGRGQRLVLPRALHLR